MIIDCDLISYNEVREWNKNKIFYSRTNELQQSIISHYYTAEEILPYPQYTSGEKGDGSIYRFAKPSKISPVLTVEQDIILNNGTGIKNGFYQVVLNDDFDFLLLFETGILKAKIPVISIAQRNDVKPVKQKVSKKKPKKNNKGKDSEEFIYQNAQIYFDPPNNSYVLIYELGNTKAVGVIKL